MRRRRTFVVTVVTMALLLGVCIAQAVVTDTGSSYAADLSKKHKTYKKFKVIKTIKRDQVWLYISDPGNGTFPTTQAMAYMGDGKIATLQNNVRGYMMGSKARVNLYKENRKLKKRSKTLTLGHSNGMTYKDGMLYVAKGMGSNRRVDISAKTLKIKGHKDLKWELSAIAYDRTTGKFCIGYGDRLFCLNEKMTKMEKKVMKKKPYYGAQDQGYYKGVVYSCVSVDKHNHNYISMYDNETGKYYGSYAIGFDAELEDCEISETGYLYILIHKKGTRSNYIYKTKKKLALK